MQNILKFKIKREEDKVPTINDVLKATVFSSNFNENDPEANAEALIINREDFLRTTPDLKEGYEFLGSIGMDADDKTSWSRLFFFKWL